MEENPIMPPPNDVITFEVKITIGIDQAGIIAARHFEVPDEMRKFVMPNQLAEIFRNVANVLDPAKTKIIIPN